MVGKTAGGRDTQLEEAACNGSCSMASTHLGLRGEDGRGDELERRGGQLQGGGGTVGEGGERGDGHRPTVWWRNERRGGKV